MSAYMNNVCMAVNWTFMPRLRRQDLFQELANYYRFYINNNTNQYAQPRHDITKIQ